MKNIELCPRIWSAKEVCGAHLTTQKRWLDMEGVDRYNLPLCDPHGV